MQLLCKAMGGQVDNAHVSEREYGRDLRCDITDHRSAVRRIAGLAGSLDESW